MRECQQLTPDVENGIATVCATVNVSLGLSPRQLQIVYGILRDDDETTMARRLGISRNTVHVHVERLYRRLAVRSRCQLAVRILLTYITLVNHTGVGANLGRECI